MSAFGALSKLAKMLAVKGPELKDAAKAQKLNDTAYMLSGGERVSTRDKRELLDFLRNEGASPEWADMYPGARPHAWGNGEMSVQQFRAPGAEDRLFRGAAPSLKLGEPTFTTTEPRGALWYATEGPAANYNGFGAIGEYRAQGANPARLRDMYRTLLENPGLEGSLGPSSNYNVWDWLYSPEFRAAMKDRGFNSAIGSDPLERGDIETFIGFGKDVLKPVSRRIVGFEGNPIGENFKEVIPLGDDYVQFGKTRPWTRKKAGGLAQCACNKDFK